MNALCIVNNLKYSYHVCANEIERSPRGSASSHISLCSHTSLQNLALYPHISSSLLPFKAFKDAQIDYAD